MGANRNAYWILIGKPEGKTTLVRPGRTWVDNMNMDGMARIGLIWLRVRDRWNALVST
jgi:hypothetical protein